MNKLSDSSNRGIEITMTTNGIYGTNEVINNLRHKTLVTSITNCSIIMVPSDVFKNNIPTAYQHYKTSVNSNKQTSKHKIGIN